MKLCSIFLLLAVVLNKHASAQPLSLDECLVLDPNFVTASCAQFSQNVVLTPQQILICSQDPASPLCPTGRSGQFDALCAQNGNNMPQCQNLNAQEIATLSSACNINPNLAFCGPPTARSALICTSSAAALGCSVPNQAQLQQIVRNCQLNPASCTPGTLSGGAGAVAGAGGAGGAGANRGAGGAGANRGAGGNRGQAPAPRDQTLDDIRGAFAAGAVDPQIPINQRNQRRPQPITPGGNNGGNGNNRRNGNNRGDNNNIGNGNNGGNGNGNNRRTTTVSPQARLVPGQTCNCRSELDSLNLRTCPSEDSPLVRQGCLCVCCSSNVRC